MMDLNKINLDAYYDENGKISQDMLQKAYQSKLLSSLMGKLSDEDQNKITSLLSDKDAVQQLLSSPQAAETLRNFMKEK